MLKAVNFPRIVQQEKLLCRLKSTFMQNQGNNYNPDTDNSQNRPVNNLLPGWMETRVFPILSKLNHIKFLQAIRESVFSSIPFLIVGFLVLFFVVNKSGTISKRVLDSFSGTLGLPGLWISFYLPFAMRKGVTSRIQAIFTGFLSFGLYIISFPAIKMNFIAVSNFLSLLSKGGILIAILLGGIILFLEDRICAIIKPRSTSPVEDIDKVSDEKSSQDTTGSPAGKMKNHQCITGISTAFILLLIPLIIMKTNGVNIYRWAEVLMDPLITAGDTLPAAMIIVFLMSLFYLFGIHGSGVVGGAVLPFYLVLYNENVAARAAGLPLPHIITPSFFIWSMIGGTGATLPLCVYMLTSKVKRLRDLGKVSILPSLVNINEPVIFGVPLILNPVMAIPFLFAPVLIAVINYAAIYYSLAGRIFIMAPFVIPQPFHAYACTLDVRNLVLLFIDIVIVFIIYYPFFRMLEREEKKNEVFK